MLLTGSGNSMEEMESVGRFVLGEGGGVVGVVMTV